MSDKQFQALINRTWKVKQQFYVLLETSEAEYERRYGSNPSDIDDDSWIDTMHQPGGKPPTVVADGLIY